MIRASAQYSGEGIAGIVVNPTIPSFVLLSHASRQLAKWEWSPSFDLTPAGLLAAEDDRGGIVTCAAFHPSGRYIAVCRKRGPIEIRSYPDGELHLTVGSGSGYAALSYSPDGEHLLTICSYPQGGGRHNRIETYSLITGELVQSFFEADVGIAWHPTGEVFATASTGQAGSSVNFASYLGAPSVLNIAFMSALRPTGVFFSPSGDTLAIIGDLDGFGVELLEFPSCRLLHRILYQTMAGDVSNDPLPKQACYSPDGARLYLPLISGRVSVLDIRTGREIESNSPHNFSATAISVEPTGEFCLVGHKDGLIELHRLSDLGPPAVVVSVSDAVAGMETAESTDSVSNMVFDFDTEPAVARP